MGARAKGGSEPSGCRGFVLGAVGPERGFPGRGSPFWSRVAAESFYRLVGGVSGLTIVCGRGFWGELLNVGAELLKTEWVWAQLLD